MNAFLSEAAVMLSFDHTNVLALLGVCFDAKDGIPLIVLPMMVNGDLKSFLVSKRIAIVEECSEDTSSLLSFPEVGYTLQMITMCWSSDVYIM